MNDMFEGDVVYHKETGERCTIVNLFNGKATVRTEENVVMECDLNQLAIEMETLNVF